MRVRVTASGHEQYQAWREGEHDDMVLAGGTGLLGREEGLSGESGGGRYWMG